MSDKQQGEQQGGHTLGPYEIWGDDEYSGVPFINIGRGDGTPEGRTVCHVQPTCIYDPNGTCKFVLTEQDWATARLFKAAPDTADELARVKAKLAAVEALSDGLAKALEYLADECDPHMDDDHNPHAAPLALARAALAKHAKGGGT